MRISVAPRMLSLITGFQPVDGFLTALEENPDFPEREEKGASDDRLHYLLERSFNRQLMVSSITYAPTIRKVKQ